MANNTTNKRWKIAFHDSTSIRGVIHSLDKVIPRAEFVIKTEEEKDESGNSHMVYFLKVDATDVAQVCQLNTKLRLEYTENIPEDLSFVLDCKELLTAFDIMLPEFAIFFEGIPGSPLILFRGYEADKRSHEVKCTLNTYVTDDYKLVIPQIDWEYLLEIDLHMMKKNLRNVTKINSELVKLQLYLSEEQNTSQRSITVLSWEGRSKIEHIMHCTTQQDPSDGSIRVRTTGELDEEHDVGFNGMKLKYEGTFSADKLEMFVKALSGGPNAKLLMEVVNNMPMNIVYNIGDESNGSYIKLLLAPRNSDEEMEDMS